MLKEFRDENWDLFFGFGWWAFFERRERDWEWGKSWEGRLGEKFVRLVFRESDLGLNEI